MSAEPVLPEITDLSRPFWDGCRAGELRLQACLPHGHLRYPISELCPVCLSHEHEWRLLSGDATILTYAIFHRAYHPAWEAHVPYNVVLVQLVEGPRMFGNVLPLSRTDLQVGAPVRVRFDQLSDEVTVPRWEVVE